MSGVEIRQVATASLGEGPHWDQDNQALLFVDIDGGDIHRIFTKTGKHQILHVAADETGGTVSFVIPVEGDRDLFVVGLGRSLAVVRWSTSDPDRYTVKAQCILHTVDSHSPKNRFNDGKCDPEGRLWAGTLGPQTVSIQPEKHKASLFRLDSDLKLSPMVDSISLSNGLAWSHDRKTFYYIDSSTFCVEAFDYEVCTGTIGKRRTIVDYKDAGLQKHFPDGMCIDESGCLWVAIFFGKKVICIDPNVGKIIRTVEIPAHNTTSVCWGGPDYETLFVTSAKIGLTEEQLKNPAEGGTFAVTGLGVRGVPPTNFKAHMAALQDKFKM